VAEALRRAALRARELARQTHTPVVVYRNGKVESQIPDDTARAGGAERREG
jgi:diaminopimelate decarboxylase